ncbi:MAG: aminoacyl-tRNA hydrolase [Clostridium sp.]|jgi:PTH1 family peptidyl-tRNA hydrolase|nr:aminoacyl-tRNA hydrolase [Clostridium sp.]
MFLIVGLGNPGREYENTRHNIGFAAIDIIAEKYNIDVNRTKFKGEYGEGFINGNKVILLKPYTFMNLSGESVREAIDFYKLTEEEVLIIYDDISLEVGRLRIREKGSAGGHNGIKSIINHMGTDVFTRIKIGVGAPKGDLVNHVLGKFSKEEVNILKQTLDVVAKATEDIIANGAKDAMNKFNGFSPNK